jgi:hypothetical protein
MKPRGLPPLPTDCNPKRFAFEAVERKSVVAGFDGGTITSNAGALLLRHLDQGLGLIRRFAGCFTDRRDPRYVEHRLETLLASASSVWRWGMKTSTTTTNCARTR